MPKYDLFGMRIKAYNYVPSSQVTDSDANTTPADASAIAAYQPGTLNDTDEIERNDEQLIQIQNQNDAVQQI